jgi:hypothetical protein
MRIDDATRDCLLGILAEIIPILAVTQLIRYLTERGLRGLTEAAAKRAIFRILRSAGTRIVPLIGFALILARILRAICHCFERKVLPEPLCDFVDVLP